MLAGMVPKLRASALLHACLYSAYERGWGCRTRSPSPGSRLWGLWGCSALTFLFTARDIPLHGGQRTGRLRVSSKLLPNSSEVLPGMFPRLCEQPLLYPPGHPCHRREVTSE